MQSGTRLSTKDLIGSIRQEKGLPSAEMDSAQQLGAVTITPGIHTQLPPATVVQQVPVTSVLVQSVPHQPMSAAAAPNTLSVESSEAYGIAQQPQAAGTTSISAAGQPMLPQPGLLELVSNPLYLTKSLDVSRTTSTSPTRLETNAVVNTSQAQTESDMPGDSAVVQVSDQPILSSSQVTQTSTSEVGVAEVHLTEQPMLSPGNSVRNSALEVRGPAGHVARAAGLQMADQPNLPRELATEQNMPVNEAEIQDSAVLRSSDQPILAPAMAVGAVTTVQTAPTREAVANAGTAVLQTSHQSSLVSAIAAGMVNADKAPTASEAEHLAVLQTPDQHNPGPAVPAEAFITNEAVPVSEEVKSLSQTQAVLPMQQLSDKPILAAVDGSQANLPSQASEQPAAMVSDQSAVSSLTTDAGVTIAVSDAPILSQAATQAVQAEPVPVMSGQLQLVPISTHAEFSSRQFDQDHILAASNQSWVQTSEQHIAQPQAEPVPVISSQPRLGPVISHAESSSQQLNQQQILVTSNELQGQAAAPHIAQFAAAHEPVPAILVSNEQAEATAQGMLTHPPMPALPSTRRSRSDLRSSQQVQSSSVRRSISILQPMPEASQPAHRSSPVSQLRRSVTSLQAAPVPTFHTSITSSQVQLQERARQPPPVLVPVPVTPQLLVGPLQQGFTAPTQVQAYDSSLVQPMTGGSLAIPVTPPEPSPVIDPYQVHVVMNSKPVQATEPPRPVQVNMVQQQQAHPILLQQSIQTGMQQQQPNPALLQHSRSYEVSPQRPPAVLVEQTSPIIIQDSPQHMLAPAPMLMQQQAPVSMQTFRTSSPQMLATQQHPAPTFMTSIDAGAPIMLPPRPAPVVPAPAYSPTKFLRTHTWSPSPAILHPAQPGQAASPPETHGPLGMNVQQSWSAVPPALLTAQTTEAVSPPSARFPEGDYSYGFALPVSSTARDYMNSREFAPAVAPVSRAMYQHHQQQQQGSVRRVLHQQVSLPSSPVLLGAASSRDMYQQPGPLSGGVMTQQAAPVSRQLYQQVSMPNAVTTTRSMPVSPAAGTVIQPGQGPVVVGEQSTAVMTKPLATHSRGFSIVPLQSPAGPSPGNVQSGTDMDMHMRAGQAAGMQQLQTGAVTQSGGGHAKRALEAFGRASRSSLNADASVNTSYQSDRSMQQVTVATVWVSCRSASSTSPLGVARVCRYT